jgi:hypothetical protein
MNPNRAVQEVMTITKPATQKRSSNQTALSAKCLLFRGRFRGLGLKSGVLARIFGRLGLRAAR